MIVNPKLTAAFEELTQRGYVTGFYEAAWREVTDVALLRQARGQTVRGAVFNSGVGLTRDGREIPLEYGPIENASDDSQYIEIAKAAIAVFEEHGLTVEWGGTAGHCIIIKDAKVEEATPPTTQQQASPNA